MFLVVDVTVSWSGPACNVADMAVGEEDHLRDIILDVMCVSWLLLPFGSRLWRARQLRVRKIPMIRCTR